MTSSSNNSLLLPTAAKIYGFPSSLRIGVSIENCFAGGDTFRISAIALYLHILTSPKSKSLWTKVWWKAYRPNRSSVFVESIP